MSSHICHKRDYCVCSSQALEPDERCEFHGCGEYPPRCVECGKFLQLQPTAPREGEAKPE